MCKAAGRQGPGALGNSYGIGVLFPVVTTSQYIANSIYFLSACVQSNAALNSHLHMHVMLTRASCQHEIIY
jgi:hypothetical protein